MLFWYGVWYFITSECLTYLRLMTFCHKDIQILLLAVFRLKWDMRSQLYLA